MAQPRAGRNAMSTHERHKSSYLPPVVKPPEYKLFEAGDQQVREIRKSLQPLGLTAF